MIVITGTAGFIGSNMITKLYDAGYTDIVAVDLDNKNSASSYLDVYPNIKYIDAFDLFDFITQRHTLIQFVVHLGACSDTTEYDPAVFDRLNLGYSIRLWDLCTEFGLPFIYASSAATYGDGCEGYSDGHDTIQSFKPLNLYAQSKHDFDLFVLKQEKTPPFWAGLKFFNVYGPKENHKECMTSVVFKAFHQILETGTVRLFKSKNSAFKDGEQLRDFLFVDDACDVMLFLMENRKFSAIYNIGSGEARSFSDLVNAVFTALNKPKNISFIDMPEKLVDKYQYYTRADVSKLRSIGYQKPFTSLEKGVELYVKNYLCKVYSEKLKAAK